uniref:Mercuric reductase n=1 Tax=Alexandrium monilatum TaxID=311494 RepID=A0A7S4WEP3_9DINO
MAQAIGSSYRLKTLEGSFPVPPAATPPPSQMQPSWSEEKAEAPVPADSGHTGVWPLDEHNARLLDCVHPRGWENPERPADFVYDLVAVGAGAGGLVSAKQSARRGARSALVEQHLAGGDCLNVGCVPSKALLRCARAAAEIRRADLGMEPSPGDVQFAKVMQRMRRLRAQIAPVDSCETTVKAGADMYIGKATFTGPNELKVGDKALKFRKAVIATGGRAKVPPIPGLAEAPHLTNATLFNLTELPPRFVVLGGGPIGLEMAQAFRRFGSQVTVLEGLGRILGPEDADAAVVVHRTLEHEGVRILTSVSVKSVQHTDGKPWPEIRIEVGLPEKEAETICCDALLVATGRAPNVEGLGLEAAGVEFKPGLGVKVNDDLTTTNPDILAVGDAIDHPEFRFTHMAGTMAGMAVQNALFEGEDLPVNAPSRRLSELVVPRCTYTEPEVASCGVSNAEAAKAKGIDVDAYTSQLDDNDRGILEGAEAGGFVRILCRKGTDEIIGATVLAERAGDMLAELTLAAQNRLGLAAVARTVHPYPTMGEAIQQCALQYNRARWRRLSPGA